MQLTILSTSDVHGYVRADDFRRPLRNDGLGVARATSVLADYQAKGTTPDHFVLTIENGDFLQGSPLTQYVSKQPLATSAIYAELADTMQVDVRVLGNHEFNYGRTYLEAILAEDAKLLNANVIDTMTEQPFIGQPYRIFEKDGFKTAVIGVTTQYVPNWEKAEHIQNLRFDDPVTTVTRYVAELQDQVDAIVVAYHGGYAEDLQTGAPLEPLTGENQGYQLVQVPGVDAVVTGHQHRRIAEVVNGVPTTQPGYRGDHVGVMTLDFDDAKVKQGATAELVATDAYPEAAAIVDQITPLQTATDAWLDRPVGQVGDNMLITDHFAARLNHHPFIELVNQVQMAATDTTIAMGSIFNDEVRGLPASVTLRDVLTNYIYPNTLVVEVLTGAEIKAALEVNATYFELDDQGAPMVNPRYLEPKVEHYNYDVWSGVSYTFDLQQPVGERVVELQKDGRPLDLMATYEVALNNYRATGAGGFPMFTPSKIVREVPMETAELISAYILEHPEIKLAQPTNFKVTY